VVKCNWTDVVIEYISAISGSQREARRRYGRGLSEITATPLVLPSLDKGIYGANVCSLDT
jgi:hypothetical protein